MWILIVLIVLLCLYLLALRGRRRHPGLARLRRWSYAHRGLHDETLPENSMGAFRAALKAGYGIELDVHLTADGNLAVIHDSSLMRTVGADVCVEHLNLWELSRYNLLGSREKIPTLEEVLELFSGKAPLIIELKTKRGNYAPLCRRVMEALRDYPGDYCIESFDPFCVYYLKKHYPQVIRGQLSQNFLKEKGLPFPWILRFMVTNHLHFFLIRPDFAACRFEDRNLLSTRLVRKLWGVQGVAWTIRTQEAYDTALSQGWMPIFESINPKGKENKS